MTKSVVSVKDGSPTAVREPRPFLYLEPARLPRRDEPLDPVGRDRLEAVLTPAIPQLVRALVDFTIALQNRSALERGHAQPIQLSVLNRRRRAARSWLLAIAAGKIDAATRHAVATQWIPTLVASGPELGRATGPGRRLLEFVRGAATAWLFDEPAESLLPHARALQVLETTLAVHLAGLLQQAPAPQ